MQPNNLSSLLKTITQLLPQQQFYKPSYSFCFSAPLQILGQVHGTPLKLRVILGAKIPSCSVIMRDHKH